MKIESGNGDALLRSALKYQEALTVYAYSILRDWALAQDAVMEALAVVHQKQDTFRPGADVFPWIRQIVRNRSVLIIRDRKHERYFENDAILDLLDQQFDASFDDRSVAALRIREKAMEICMRKMAVPVRNMLVSFYHDHASCEALAHKYNKSANAVRISLSRAREFLRKCLYNQLETVKEQP